jgi:2-C-methyl-D-erythritol 4-phosphate cytidylyltransferase
MNVTVIILAAGKGTRMNATKNKVFLKLKKPILAHTIGAFEKNKHVNDIFIVANDAEIDLVKLVVEEHNFKKVVKYVIGGLTRQQSCYNGVSAVKNSDIIMVHDGARPFVRQETINN